MTDTFTIKEIVSKLLSKIEKMDDKIDDIHTQTKMTNGTVILHTKLIWGAYGFTFAVLMSIVMWII